MYITYTTPDNAVSCHYTNHLLIIIVIIENKKQLFYLNSQVPVSWLNYFAAS